MKQYILTPAAGKRLIGKAAARHPALADPLKMGTVVVMAGTTNGYVAEELLGRIHEVANFDKRRFFRGITLSPAETSAQAGRLPDEQQFPGDVVIVKGVWQWGQTIFDVVDDLAEGDVIMKGANAVDVPNRRAGILVAHPKGGTIGASLQAVIGRRVRLILPVGLEKRVHANLDLLAAQCNTPGSEGPRFWPVPGEVITELDAIAMLTGASAELLAGGGVCGAEGSVRLAVSGTPEEEDAAQILLEGVMEEPLFSL